MKIYAIAAIVLASAVTAKEEASIHLRIHGAEQAQVQQPVHHHHHKTVEQWGQCKWDGKDPVPCSAGLTCRVSSPYYGQCLKSVADVWGQCGGKGWKGECAAGSECKVQDDWYSQCKPKAAGPAGPGVALYQQCGGKDYKGSKICVAGADCVRSDDYYSQCRPKTEHHHHHHHHKELAQPVKAVAEWGQCKEGGKPAVPCESGLTCRESSPYYGQCLKTVAGAWGQCGGKGWDGLCAAGSECKRSNEWYSQCIPKPAGPAGPGVALYQQCGGKTYKGPTVCVSGANCVRSDDWYSQCRPTH